MPVPKQIQTHFFGGTLYMADHGKSILGDHDGYGERSQLPAHRLYPASHLQLRSCPRPGAMGKQNLCTWLAFEGLNARWITIIYLDLNHFKLRLIRGTQVISKRQTQRLNDAVGKPFGHPCPGCVEIGQAWSTPRNPTTSFNDRTIADLSPRCSRRRSTKLSSMWINTKVWRCQGSSWVANSSER